jgi:outer membrane PBP1 activator LpoA protein
MKKITLLSILLTISLTGCNSIRSASSSSPAIGPQTTASVSDPALYGKSSNTTWHTLQHTPLPTLQEAAATNQDPNAKGWLSLAVISKKYSTNSPQLIKELQNWRNAYPSHPGNTLFPNDSTLNQIASAPQPTHIAVLLPLHGSMAASGQIVRSGFLSAYYDNMGQASQKQAISFYDTNETQDLGSLYQKAVNEGADLVVGPLTKAEVDALHNFNHFNVRVLALNYSASSFFSSLPANFYEFGLSPVEETQQMSDKASHAGHTQALVIASDDAWGHRVTNALNSSWKSKGGSINDTLYFTKQSNPKKIKP